MTKERCPCRHKCTGPRGHDKDLTPLQESEALNINGAHLLTKHHPASNRSFTEINIILGEVLSALHLLSKPWSWIWERGEHGEGENPSVSVPLNGATKAPMRDAVVQAMTTNRPPAARLRRTELRIWRLTDGDAAHGSRLVPLADTEEAPHAPMPIKAN
ncbi:unnamed protein product [Leuciscus chuanchicus]